MKFQQRVLAFVMAAVLMLTPVAAFAEDAWVAPAGEITTTAISDSYIGGEQINLSAALGLETILTGEELGGMLGMDAETAQKKLEAVTSLLEKCTLEMSFYDDFGTARIHGELMLDGVNLLSGTALIFEDGSMQLMTSLTGQMVLTLPAGTFSEREQIDIFSLMYGDFGGEEEEIPAEEMTAADRLKAASSDMLVTVFSHLLGWVSGVQMETGELYTFDDTYLEPTDDRDPVAQRMIGKIYSGHFIGLFWQTIVTIRDNCGEFQQALADCLAERGVTRYQVRQVIDGMFPDQVMDPAVDWVQPFGSIADDGALCTMDDVAYSVKKLAKWIDDIWYEAIETDLSMIVSYDDYGAMVGFDAVVPKFVETLPYEGDFTYSIKTDDFWQRRHTSHGELQVFDGNRVVGDMSIQFGEDVDGVNANYFTGSVDVVNKEAGTAVGVGVDSKLDFTAVDAEDGSRGERFEGRAALQLRSSGDVTNLLNAELAGETTTSDGGFAVSAKAGVDAAGVVKLTTDLELALAEYEDIAFAGGEAIDLTALDDVQLEKIKGAVVGNAAGLAVSLALRPGLLRDMMTIIE